MTPIVSGVLEAELLIGGFGDLYTHVGDIACLVGFKAEAEQCRVHENETVSTKCSVDDNGPDACNFDVDVELVRKGWDVTDPDTFSLAVFAHRLDFDQAARRFEDHACDWFTHGDDACIQKHGCDAHCVRAGHRWRVGWLHNDP